MENLLKMEQINKLDDENLGLMEAVNLVKSFERGENGEGWIFWTSTLNKSEAFKGRVLHELGVI